MRKLLKFYPYTITRAQELLDRNAKARLGFSLMFLARLEVHATVILEHLTE